MIKQILIIMLVFLPICIADQDYTLMPSLTNGSMINPYYNTTSSQDQGFYYIPLSIVTSSSSGAGTSVKTSTLYYDLNIYTDKKKYSVLETINITVVIINKGYVPDRDGILHIYMLDPNGNYIANITNVFELIPPTCENGQYNAYTDKCELYNGTIQESLKWVKSYGLTFEATAKSGRYPIKAEYNSQVQPLIKSETYVDMYAPMRTIIIVGAIVAYLIYRKRRRRGDD